MSAERGCVGGVYLRIVDVWHDGVVFFVIAVIYPVYPSPSRLPAVSSHLCRIGDDTKLCGVGPVGGCRKTPQFWMTDDTLLFRVLFPQVDGGF